VGLIARAIEAQGIPTVCVVMNRDIAENVGIPRSLHVHFPYGAPLGPAGHAETQLAVIREALALFATATQPGVVVESSVEWPE
jgi:D-proline reductase (dithiol) PrdB